MHRGDDATARQEGAEECQSEGHTDEYKVPYLQHVLALLDHHRMEIGGHHQPRHEGRVFHRIPGPVAAPSKDFVSPSRAEKIAEGEKEPREDRPSARAANPRIV